MTIDHKFRRNRIKALIKRDPWTATYVHQGTRAEDAVTSGTFDCRFFPMSRYAGNSRAGSAITPTADIATGIILADTDAPVLRNGDTVRLTHNESGVVRDVVVTFPRQTPDKWEIEVDEIG